jgi:DNA-directed RNA polymerase specialized sigma24 family protein
MSTAEFGQLIDREHDFLSQLAMKLTKRRDDADDLLQDTYYKALKNKDKFATGTNLKGLVVHHNEKYLHQQLPSEKATKHVCR